MQMTPNSCLPLKDCEFNIVTRNVKPNVPCTGQALEQDRLRRMSRVNDQSADKVAAHHIHRYVEIVRLVEYLPINATR